jgi:hypothetical protein
MVGSAKPKPNLRVEQPALPQRSLHRQRQRARVGDLLQWSVTQPV